MSADHVISQIAEITGLAAALSVRSVFSPLDYSPVAWFDAYRGANALLWADQSGHGHHAAATGTVVLSATGLNSRPTMEFTGGGRFITDSLFGAAFNTACTIFVVSQAVGLAANKVLLSDASANLYLSHTGTNASFVAANLTPNSTNMPYTTAAGIDVWTYNGAQYQLIYDRLFKSSDIGSSNTHSGVACTGNLGLTGALTMGDIVGGGFSWPGQISEVILYAAALINRQIRNVYDYLSAKWGLHSRKFVLCCGNSLTSGTGTTGGATQQILPTGSNYPGQMWASLGAGSWEVRTDAYPGRRFDQILTETPEFGDRMYLRASPKNICVLWELTNTLASTQSATQTLNLALQCINDRQAAGYSVVVPNCLPRTDGVYAGFAADHLTLNAQLASAAAAHSYTVANVAGDARLQTTTNATYFDADHVHLTDSGAAVAAGIIKAAVLLQ